jgi:hypothetical protein
MKNAAGCVFLLCFALLAGGFGALYFLERIRPATLEEPSPPTPAPDPNKYLSWVGKLHQFRRVEAPDNYNMTYGFVDYSGNQHQVTCDISKEDYQQERDHFGYVKNEIEAKTDAALQKFVNQQIKHRRISSYMSVIFHDGGGYHWEWKLPGDLEPKEEQRAKTAINDILEIVKREVPKKENEIEAALYEEKGFRLQNDEIRIDYKKLALQSEPNLNHCYSALHQSVNGYNERQYIGLYLAFLQEIRYEVPPMLDGDRMIQGLWVPAEVLVNNQGDCDSKSVTFAAFCKKLGVPVIVIRIPGHVLVGVQSTPGPDQEFVRVGNRYFVLCEPAGPAKLYPGNEGRDHFSGNYEYTLIEPSDT